MTIKIAMIGAGSVVFSRNLTGDILSLPEFKDVEIVYMDIDAERLEVAGLLCQKMADAIGAKPTIRTTMDRREAVRGAAFVINMVQIGGFDSTLVDFEIPRRHGLRFTIADTTGPGGLFRALRTYPMLHGLCQDMMEMCPDATLLNYSNPMSMNMQTVFRTSSVRAVGLCHSVQGTFNEIMGYIGEDPARVAFTCAGINHMAFYTMLKKNGVDLYPRLFAAMNDPDIYRRNKVRFEIMRRLGHFVTESSEHNAEYCPWFMPHGDTTIRQLNIPLDEYLRRCDSIVDTFEELRGFARSTEPSREVCVSHEYCSAIMHAMVTGTPTVIYGNLPNGGTISNLPRTAIVEAPTLVDRTGLHHAQVGELPPQLVGYMQPHITQHELFIRAATEGRRDHVYQACMFDPLTAATVPPDQIVEMCDAMIAAYGDQLPKLDAPTLVPTSGKTFPRVDGKDLRASWDAVAAQASKDSIQNWKILGPFPASGQDTAKIGMPTPFEASMVNSTDSRVDLAATWEAVQRNGAPPVQVGWKSASAGKEGFVNLGQALGSMEWAIAYGYTEIEDTHGREVEIGLGSDDAVRVWINGTVVHTETTARSYTPRSDKIRIRLRPGINRMLLKIVNYRGGWGFGVQLPPAAF